MGKKKIINKMHGEGTSLGHVVTDGGKYSVDYREEEQRKKRKDDEDDERAEKEKWVNKMQEREFLCERQLERKGLFQHDVIDIIQRQGLSFFFDPLGKYRKTMVRTFYENMVVDLGERQITSRVGGKTVIVTPDSIAVYLNYRRPATTTYPKKKWHMPHEKQLEILTVEPGSNDEANGKGKYISGSLRNTYRTVNKFMHHNISPFSLEKTPSKKDGELLVVFGSETDKVDWAQWIWCQMKDFWDHGGLSANIPFPIMVTALCEEAGYTKKMGDGLVGGKPGPITLGSMKKSEATSKPLRPKITAASLPTASKLQERNKQWHLINHARQQILLENQRKLETEQRRAKRREGMMMRLLKWLVACEGQRRGELYKETQTDKEDDTDEEGERLHNFEEEDTEEEEYEEEGDDDDE